MTTKENVVLAVNYVLKTGTGLWTKEVIKLQIKVYSKNEYFFKYFYISHLI